MKFQPENYSPAVAELLAVEAPYPLVPKNSVGAAEAKLLVLDHAAIFGEASITDREMADACLSGLWLRFDFLDRSHTISQEIHTSTGSYWHGIMHRREPDWSNAKYWFRQVGDHEVFDDLLAETQRVAQSMQPDARSQKLIGGKTWDPFAFVDLCEEAHREGGALKQFCLAVQLEEWRLLFDYCFERARA